MSKKRVKSQVVARRAMDINPLVTRLDIKEKDLGYPLMFLRKP